MGQYFAKNKADMGACVGKPGALIAPKSKSKKHTFYSIGDQYTTLDEVQAALRTAGLESSNLIIGIDFTKSNTWTGERSFGGRCLHDTTAGVNPYQSVISIMGILVGKDWNSSMKLKILHNIGSHEYNRI